MLNVFPIQFLAPFAYFFLRIALGAVCLRIGFRLVRHKTASTFRATIGTLFIVAGSLLLLGLYTQIGALLALGLTLIGSIKRLGVFAERMIPFLMCTIALSLVITGSGIFAFDLPI